MLLRFAVAIMLGRRWTAWSSSARRVSLSRVQPPSATGKRPTLLPERSRSMLSISSILLVRFCFVYQPFRGRTFCSARSRRLYYRGRACASCSGRCYPGSLCCGWCSGEFVSPLCACCLLTAVPRVKRLRLIGKCVVTMFLGFPSLTKWTGEYHLRLSCWLEMGPLDQEVELSLVRVACQESGHTSM